METPNDASWDDPDLEEATADREGQPGYDLDEGELYEEGAERDDGEK